MSLLRENHFFALSLTLLSVGCVSPQLSTHTASKENTQGTKNILESSSSGSSTTQAPIRDELIEPKQQSAKNPDISAQQSLQLTEAGGNNSKANVPQAVQNGLRENSIQSPQKSIELASKKAPPSGTVSESLSDTVVEGGLSKTTFGRVLQTNREKILTCYKRELLVNSDAQGLVLTKIDINQTGRVAAVSVLQSDLGDVTFENCIVSAIKRWKFPTPRGGREVRVSHPFRFSP